MNALICGTSSRLSGAYFAANDILWRSQTPFRSVVWTKGFNDAKAAPRANIYGFPRTEDGIIKIGYRGIKVCDVSRAKIVQSCCRKMQSCEHARNASRARMKRITVMLTVRTVHLLRRPPFGTRITNSLSEDEVYRSEGESGARDLDRGGEGYSQHFCSLSSIHRISVLSSDLRLPP